MYKYKSSMVRGKGTITIEKQKSLFKVWPTYSAKAKAIFRCNTIFGGGSPFFFFSYNIEGL